MNILISIIIPVYNASKTIKECIEAIYESDFTGYEILVIDDGSTDDSENIVNKFQDVRYFKKANEGSAAAKNYGAKIAKGEYLYFLDSDVIIYPNTLTLFYKTSNEYNVDLVAGRYSTKPMNNKIIHHYKAILDYVLYIPKKCRNIVAINHQIGGGGDFYSKQSFEDLGGFLEIFSGASAEREELYIRFYNKGYKSAANPFIKTRHYYPELKQLIKNYIYRIYENAKLFDKYKPKFSTHSIEKGVVASISGFLLLIGILFGLLGILNWVYSLVFGVLFLYFNRELLVFSYKKKGFIFTIQLFLIHLFISTIISGSGLMSIAIVKYNRYFKGSS